MTVPSHHLSVPLSENHDFGDINVLELWPVLLAVHTWGYLLKNRKVRLWTDNTQVMQMILTGRSRSVNCMGWLRDLFWICAIYNIHIVASHIKSVDNIVPDYLSRLFDTKHKGSISVELLQDLCCYRDGWVDG